MPPSVTPHVASAPPVHSFLWEDAGGTWSLFLLTSTPQGEPRWSETPGLTHGVATQMKENLQNRQEAQRLRAEAQQQEGMRQKGIPPAQGRLVFAGPALGDDQRSLLTLFLFEQPDGTARWTSRQENADLGVLLMFRDLASRMALAPPRFVYPSLLSVIAGAPEEQVSSAS